LSWQILSMLTQDIWIPASFTSATVLTTNAGRGCSGS
jgi:hypothetical protein